MPRRADKGEGVFRVAVQDRVCSGNRSARRQQRILIGGSCDVGRRMVHDARSLPANLLDGFDQLWVMHARNLLHRGRRRFDLLHIRELRKQRLQLSQSARTLRVVGEFMSA